MEFDDAIVSFNKMYGLPVPSKPDLHANGDVKERLKAFLSILRDEVDEGDELLKKLETGIDDLDALTELADWLGDLQVYCASEMARFGLPLYLVLNAIMQSNASKLGADGKPIYDERGKVCKGPGYWRPEPKIKEILGFLMEAR